MIGMEKEKTNSINKLFSEWRRKQNEESDEEYEKYGTREIPKNAFLPDGIVDEAQFAQKKSRGKIGNAYCKGGKLVQQRYQ